MSELKPRITENGIEQIGQERANLIGALDELKRLDELVHIGTLEHLLDIQRNHQPCRIAKKP